MSSIERTSWTPDERKPRHRLARTVAAMAAVALLVSGCKVGTGEGTNDDKGTSSQDGSQAKKLKKKSAPICDTIAQKIKYSLSEAGYGDPAEPTILECDKEHVKARVIAGVIHTECEVNIEVTDYNENNGSPNAWHIIGFEGFPITVPGTRKAQNVISVLRETGDPDLQLLIDRCAKSPV